MPRLLQRQHKPRLSQSANLSLSLRFNRLQRPLFPACESPLPPVEPASTPWSYWRRQALREAVIATLFTTLLTSAVQGAPQLFSQSPLQSVQDVKALLLPGSAGLRLPMLDDCP